MRRCQQCQAPLPVHKGRHRPRKFCATCRPPRNRGQASPSTVVSQIRAAEPEDSLAVAAEAKLSAAGRRNEPEGVLVMQLARSIDAGGHSGASLASLSKEFCRAMEVALKDTGESGDLVDGIDWGVG